MSSRPSIIPASVCLLSYCGVGVPRFRIPLSCLVLLDFYADAASLLLSFEIEF